MCKNLHRRSHGSREINYDCLHFQYDSKWPLKKRQALLGAAFRCKSVEFRIEKFSRTMHFPGRLFSQFKTKVQLTPASYLLSSLFPLLRPCVRCLQSPLCTTILSNNGRTFKASELKATKAFTCSHQIGIAASLVLSFRE